MIERVHNATGKLVGFKAVIGAYGWLDTLFDEVNRRGIESAPDFITVDSADGGTGAAPSSLMDYVGLPVYESLPMVVDRLIEHGLRDRIKVIASGKLVTPADVAWALCVGADFCVSARGFMFCPWVYSGSSVQQEYMPHGDHDPQPATTERPGSH